MAVHIMIPRVFGAQGHAGFISSTGGVEEQNRPPMNGERRAGICSGLSGNDGADLRCSCGFAVSIQDLLRARRTCGGLWKTFPVMSPWILCCSEGCPYAKAAIDKCSRRLRCRAPVFSVLAGLEIWKRVSPPKLSVRSVRLPSFYSLQYELQGVGGVSIFIPHQHEPCYHYLYAKVLGCIF